MKPCPFCTSQEIIKDIEKVHCKSCGAVAYLSNWNSRPHVDSLKKAIDALLKAAQFALDENVNRKTITGRLKHALTESKRILTHDVQLQISNNKNKKA